MVRNLTRVAMAAVVLASLSCKDSEPQDDRSSASAQRWATAESQYDMNAAAAADLEEAQVELATVLSDIRKGAVSDGAPASAALVLLEASQSAWESYVEAQIAMEWPQDEGRWHGSIAPMCIAQRRAMLVHARAMELREILEVKDDICGARWP